MKQKKNIVLVVFTVILYLFPVFSLLNPQVENGFFILILIATYCSVVMTFSYNLYKKEVKDMSSQSLKFNKNYPMRYYGSQISSFHHVFTFESNILKELFSTINQNIISKELLPELNEVHFIDIDKNLLDTQSKSFYLSSTKPTIRESVITLAFHFNNYGKMQNIRWWLLLYGFTDWNKLFAFVAYSPLTILFWSIPYIKKEYDLINQMRKVSSSFYDDIEVITKIRSINSLVFNTLVDFLDSYNIDTSDLKNQRAQILNITVSGGKANFGNVLQGAFNKVINPSKGNN